MSNCLKVVLACSYNQKCPFCTLVLKSNDALAQPLRLKILQFFYMKTGVKSMHGSRTEANSTQIQPSNQRREITNITNSQDTKRTYGQRSEQLFPKRWPPSNRNRTKNNMNTYKVKRHRNSDTKNRQQRTTTKPPPWNGQ